jgi:DNA repair exonuclease SbcCD ATPase subunit
MHIKYIEIENIRSHKYTEFSLDQQGLCFIKGSNGSGKSTIVKGLIFCLFGIGADDVVNEAVGKNARVTIIGSKGTDTFKVERYRKHEEHKNNLYFFINGEPVPAATNTALQKKLESWIGCDYRAFLNIASFSNEMLMFASATDTERKAIFEKILQDLEIYSDFHDTAKDELARFRDERSQYARTIEIDERELDVTKQFLAQEKTKADEESQKNQNRLVVLEKKKRTLEQMEDENNKLLAKLERYTRATNVMWHWMEEQHNPANEWATNRGDIERLLSDADMLELNFCTQCNQKITAAHKKKEKLRLSKEIKKLRKLDDRLSKQCQVYEAFDDKLERLQLKTKLWQGKIGRRNDVLEQLREVNVEIDEITLGSRSDEAVRKLSSKVKKVSKAIARLKAMLADVDKHVVYQEEVVKGFSKTGIPNAIIARALVTLEERTNSYLDILTNGLLGVSFSGFSLTKKGGVRNKIGINVISASGVSAYDKYSGGEKQRLNIAILLALRDVAELNKGVHLNCLFMDEVLDLSLDEGGIEEVLTLLKAKREEVDSIFVISPKDSVLYNTSVEFDNVYTVSKKRGFSEIT